MTNMKSKHIFFQISAFIVSLPLIAQKATPQKPNVLYILCDDMGYSDIEAYGQQMIHTPNLNYMVQNGLSFTQFYASTAVSAPSRASLMTGQHTGHTYIRGNKEIQPEGQEPLDASVKTLGDLFKEAGYTTGCFGKWGLGYPGSHGIPNKRGFDQFFGYNCQRQAHSYYPDHLWNNETRIDYPQRDVYSQDVIHDNILEFIRNNKDGLFFGYLTYTIPHAGLEQPQDSIVEMYNGKFYEANRFNGSGNYVATSNPRTQFAAMITRLDTYVGQIINELETLGIAENTILIFTSDNGYHNEGGADPVFFNTELRIRGLKRALYEGGMRVPFIVNWKGTTAPNTIATMQAAGWDMMATFTDLLDLNDTWNQPTDGISLLPLISGVGEQQEHEFLYWEFHEEGGRQAVRAGDWKLIRQKISSTPILELYNIALDPHEDNNIIQSNQEKAEELRVIMDREHVPSSIFNFGK